MVPINPELPAPTRLITEPLTEGKYYLYVPSNYTPEKRWPLVVTCHGTPPWDTAKFQVDEWSPLAEDKGCIILAPKLRGTRGDFAPRLAEQIKRQRSDERLILAAVNHVKAGYSIADDQVFLTGWSAGGYAVLYTGLRHPDVFRALAIRQGNFDRRYVKDCEPFLDPCQPIYVLYGSLDVLATDEAKKALEWMREHRLSVWEHEIYGSHRRHPKLAYDFFAKCVRELPWLRIEAFEREGDPPLAVRLRAVGSPVPTAFAWSFGDGTPVSHEPRPYHEYAEPGTYTVKLAVRIGKSKPVKRLIEIEVPRPGFGT
jgi:pimeloyl-ACP methyl ester carboxylesterase